jgi:methyl-accepting chemotaxis protein
LITSVIVSITIAVLILPLFAVANQASAQNAAQTATVERAHAYGDLLGALYMDEIRSARDLAAYPAVGAFYQQVVHRQPTWPEVHGAYLFGARGQLRLGLQLRPTGPALILPSTPTGLQAGNTMALGRALARTLTHNAEGHVLSFGAGAGPLGDLYLFEPVTNPTHRVIGAVVLRVDNQAVIGHVVTPGSVLLVAPPFIVSSATPGLARHRQVQVLGDTPARALRDPSIVSGLTPVVDTHLGSRTIVARPGTFLDRGGSTLAGAGVLENLPDFRTVVYSPAPTFLGALAQPARAPAPRAAGWVDIVLIVVVILIGGAVIQVMYQRSRVKVATAAIEEQRTELLTEDILNVSQALTVAREGDLTVEVPAAESEVGLIALMVNGLLADYSQMVAGIIRASRAVQQGALRVDEGVRTIVDSAAQQSTEMTTTAGTVEVLAASAAAVQEATRRATELASDASRSVEQGQEAVGRIGESVDSIKEAAIGTTREFKRLQEDSIRLTALVSSVKSNAENLDMQAANAALEARHLGTETGSAFATNIGRLARQAQETLADAETAVRSVIASIDAVNRRIERISEQVRLGVDEVRSVRANFEDITTTNQALVQFIEQVAGSAHAQATNAQRVATSITAIAATFRQFNEMLVASGDEMAHMRLIVADLQESVSTLKVDGTLLAEVSDEGGAPSVKSAA